MSDAFKTGDVDSSLGDELEAHCRDGQLHISVENPWAVSTETGFGYACYVTLSRDQAIKFANWILKKLAP